VAGARTAANAASARTLDAWTDADPGHLAGAGPRHTVVRRRAGIRPAALPHVPTNIRALRAFLRACLAKPTRAADFEIALCWNMVVPTRADSGYCRPSAEHVLATCPTADTSWDDGVGHAPFLEEPERFNRERAALTRRVRA
jgi:pimeloyl-ACP methyl ester carboxylesterase